MFKRLPIISLTPLAFLAAACGTDAAASIGSTSPPSVGSAVTTPAPAAPTPITGVPIEEPPTSSNPPPTEPTLPQEFVEIDDGGYDSVADMADHADVVVVATVTDTISFGRPDPAAIPGDSITPDADEHIGLTLTVDEVVKGDVDDEIRLTWWAYDVDADGERSAELLLNGIEVPIDGDRLVLFLREPQPSDAPVRGPIDTFASHHIIGLDAIGHLDGDVVVNGDTVSGDWTGLIGSTLADIRAAI